MQLALSVIFTGIAWANQETIFEFKICERQCLKNLKEYFFSTFFFFFRASYGKHYIKKLSRLTKKWLKWFS